MAKKANLVPIHMSFTEVKYLNYLQGGQSLDPETGLREYSKLKGILNKPEIKQIFIQFNDVMRQNKKVPKQLKSVIDELDSKNDIDQYFQVIPSDSEPDIRKLASLAENKEDAFVVLMPEEVVKFFDTLRGGSNLDPTEHLDQFDFFDEFIRGTATIGGAALGSMFGSPHIGAGVGNYFGKVVTGADPMSNIIPAAKIGLLSYGLGQGAKALGANMPGLASKAPGLFGSAWANSAGPMEMLGLSGGAGTAESNLLEKARASSGIGAKEAASGAGSFLGSAKDWLVPGALLGGGLFLTHKHEQAKQQEEKKRAKEQKAEIRRLRSQYGYDEPLGGEELMYFPHDPAEILKGKIHKKDDLDLHGRAAFAKGGVVGRPIVGKGKGQEDKINDDRVKEGGWIWDASTVAGFGDGSTRAGQKEIQTLEKLVARKAGNLKKYQKLDHGGQPRKVPCALSDGERYTPPEIVTALGQGSNAEGAAKLRAVTKELRKHKIAGGTDLPPAAPPIIEVLKKVG